MRKLYPVGGALIVASLGLCLTAGGALAANATQKECSTKYQADKAANKLNGMSWNQYYKQCAASAKGEAPAAPAATPAAAPAPASAPVAPAPAPAKVTKAKATPAKPAAPAPAAAGVYPTAIAPEFANQKPGDARMHTCAKQWNAIKGTSAAAGMKWTVKGGGYYSECSKRLKG